MDEVMKKQTFSMNIVFRQKFPFLMSMPSACKQLANTTFQCLVHEHGDEFAMSIRR
jgi:hypothetical protein